jgi:hypothetical protein
MDLTEYNHAMNLLNSSGIREVRDKLNTPQATQVMQALYDYVNAYLETQNTQDRLVHEAADTAWTHLMRLADDDFDGLPEP